MRSSRGPSTRSSPRGAIAAAPASVCTSSITWSPRASAAASSWSRRRAAARPSASPSQGMPAPMRPPQRRIDKVAEEDEFLQLVENQEGTPEAGPRWKVALIDDDPAVHGGTRFALSDYSLNGQQLEILSASSAAEGRELLARH